MITKPLHNLCIPCILVWCQVGAAATQEAAYAPGSIGRQIWSASGQHRVPTDPVRSIKSSQPGDQSALTDAKDGVRPAPPEPAWMEEEAARNQLRQGAPLPPAPVPFVLSWDDPRAATVRAGPQLEVPSAPHEPLPVPARAPLRIELEADPTTPPFWSASLSELGDGVALPLERPLLATPPHLPRCDPLDFPNHLRPAPQRLPEADYQFVPVAPGELLAAAQASVPSSRTRARPTDDRDESPAPVDEPARATEQGAVEDVLTAESPESAAPAQPEEEPLMRRMPPPENDVLQQIARAASTPPAEQPAAAAFDEVPAETIVDFAAGGVRLRLPEGWVVTEHPFRREIRLMIAPEDAPRDAQGVPQHGAWITYLVQTQPQAAQLPELLRDRLHLDQSSVQLGEPRPIQVDQFEALVAPFAVAKTAGRPEQQGWRVLSLAPWGLFEMHAFASPEVISSLDRHLQAILASVRLSQPPAPAYELTPEVQGAAEIVGVWKAYRSRLRLAPNGVIVIEHDRVIDVSVQKRYNVETLPTQQRIVGRFVAHRDLLEVTWDDGSRLNYRWRMNAGRLLLTDHDGVVSQLCPLLESPLPQQP